MSLVLRPQQDVNELDSSVVSPSASSESTLLWSDAVWRLMSKWTKLTVRQLHGQFAERFLGQLSASAQVETSQTHLYVE